MQESSFLAPSSGIAPEAPEAGGGPPAGAAALHRGGPRPPTFTAVGVSTCGLGVLCSCSSVGSDGLLRCLSRWLATPSALAGGAVTEVASPPPRAAAAAGAGVGDGCSAVLGGASLAAVMRRTSSRLRQAVSSTPLLSYSLGGPASQGTRGLRYAHGHGVTERIALWSMYRAGCITPQGVRFLYHEHAPLKDRYVPLLVPYKGME